MNVSIGNRWEEFVARAVETGRFASPADVIREGLRLVEEREGKLKALRHHLDGAIARGGHVTDEELGASIERIFLKLEQDSR